MKLDAARFIPVLFSFPDEDARSEAWGRLLELRAGGGRLSTRTRLERGDCLTLGFELAAAEIDGLRAEVAAAAADADGYRVCELVFPEEADRVRLGRLLIGILTNR